VQVRQSKQSGTTDAHRYTLMGRSLTGWFPAGTLQPNPGQPCRCGGHCRIGVHRWFQIAGLLPRVPHPAAKTSEHNARAATPHAAEPPTLPRVRSFRHRQHPMHQFTRLRTPSRRSEPEVGSIGLVPEAHAPIRPVPPLRRPSGLRADVIVVVRDPMHQFIGLRPLRRPSEPAADLISMRAIPHAPERRRSRRRPMSRRWRNETLLRRAGDPGRRQFC